MFRPLVSSSRVQYADKDLNLVLDLAYVLREDPVTIIVMSMPALTWPKTLYRNSLHDIRAFLDSKHKTWSIFEFRGEGTGYTDQDFAGHRIYHFQFPDHQAPPFHVYGDVVSSMREFFQEHKDGAAVLHCKAGKGRSGSMACAYMILELGKSAEEARKIFTKARMNSTSGQGVSIQSQQRYLDYLEKWREEGRRPLPVSRVQVHEITLYGVRPGIQVELGAYEKPSEDGIHYLKTLHTFSEREEVKKDGATVVLKPSSPIECPIDVCLQIERKHSSILGQIPTSVAQAWFNGHFEAGSSDSASPGSAPEGSTTISFEWDNLDGFKGSNRRGVKALDRVEITFGVL